MPLPLSMSEPVHLLIVDDEPDVPALMRQLLRRQVRAGELELSFAEDGESALRVLDETPEVDVVLTDINMPRMDGLTLLARLIDLKRVLRAVVVTAYGDMQNIRTAMNRGAFDFLTKPINIEDLTITIHKAAETVLQAKRAERLRNTFGRYVPDEVVTQLLKNPGAATLGGEKRTITILFSDLRGFSMVSERLRPEEVVELLNIYLGAMAEVITDYGGTISEFVGDGILAMFGAPIAADDHPERAVAAALAMQSAMTGVREILAERGLPTLVEGMGIGLHTGEVVVGNIGSAKRMKYTPVGSNVNLASRIESFTVGGQVLMSEATHAALGAPVSVGRTLYVTAKGFSKPVPMHQVEAIGEPFNLALPADHTALVELRSPIPVQFSLLDGKHLSGDLASGTLTHVSVTGARLDSDAELTELANLKVDFRSGEGSEDMGELYAKVVSLEAPSGGRAYVLRFTAIPDVLAHQLMTLTKP